MWIYWNQSISQICSLTTDMNSPFQLIIQWLSKHANKHILSGKLNFCKHAEAELKKRCAYKKNVCVCLCLCAWVCIYVWVCVSQSVWFLRVNVCQWESLGAFLCVCSCVNACTSVCMRFSFSPTLLVDTFSVCLCLCLYACLSPTFSHSYKVFWTSIARLVFSSWCLY